MSSMKLSMFIWALRYARLTILHKVFVFGACRRLSVPIWRAVIHDWSKFTPTELPYYGRHFFGDKGDPDGFSLAWLHHQNHNPHHWEYWVTRSGHRRPGDFASGTAPIPLPMPAIYVREMIADWMGASRAYTGSWGIEGWARKTYPT